MPDICLEHMTVAADKANRHDVFLLASTVRPGEPDGDLPASGCRSVNLTRDVAESFTPLWKKRPAP
jgi:hypothetical protein